MMGLVEEWQKSGLRSQHSLRHIISKSLRFCIGFRNSLRYNNMNANTCFYTYAIHFLSILVL